MIIMSILNMNFLLESCSLMLIFTGSVFSYFQNDYTVTNERFILSHLDENYASADFQSVMYNRTMRVINATIHVKKNVGNNIQVVIQAYKFASNEYRLFPIFLNINLCTAIAEDTFGLQNIYDCGNFTKCPIKKGTYVVCNWAPDQSKLPPHHPRGRYLAEAKIMYDNEEIAQIQWYTKVESKIEFN